MTTFTNVPTYIILVQSTIHVQFVNPDGTLERITERTLGNGRVAPDRNFWISIGSLVLASNAEAKLLRDQNAGFHCDWHSIIVIQTTLSKVFQHYLDDSLLYIKSAP